MAENHRIKSLEKVAARCCDPLFALYAAAAADGRVCPSRTHLATALSASPDSVRRAHAMLEQTGRVVTERAGRNGMRVGIVATGAWTAFSRSGRPEGALITQRRCLRCGQVFESTGAGHRICCSREAEGLDVLGQPALYY